MTTEEQPTQELLPYVKPAVERIPLSDARNTFLSGPKSNDGVTSSS